MIFVIYYINSFLHTLDFIATFSHVTDPIYFQRVWGENINIISDTEVSSSKTKHYFISFCYKNVFLAHHLVVVMKKVGDKHFSS